MYEDGSRYIELLIELAFWIYYCIMLNLRYAYVCVEHVLSQKKKKHVLSVEIFDF